MKALAGTLKMGHNTDSIFGLYHNLPCSLLSIE